MDSYQKIEKAIAYIEEHFEEQPDLDHLAAETGLSSFHFQKLFTRLAGISPKRFLQYTTLEEAKRHLRKETNLMDASYAVGLSGPSRLHDLFVAGEAATPGEYKKRGESLTIRYGVFPSPFGHCMIAMTKHGICDVTFRTEIERMEEAIARLKTKWPEATFVEDLAAIEPVRQVMFTSGQTSVYDMKLHLRGTNFQLKVWQALLQIPEGALSDYSAIANAVGSPNATRAVGSAVGSNPISFLIPCHRVLRKDGGIGGFASGTPRKRAMLAYEVLATRT